MEIQPVAAILLVSCILAVGCDRQAEKGPSTTPSQPTSNSTVTPNAASAPLTMSNGGATKFRESLEAIMKPHIGSEVDPNTKVGGIDKGMEVEKISRVNNVEFPYEIEVKCHMSLYAKDVDGIKWPRGDAVYTITVNVSETFAMDKKYNFKFDKEPPLMGHLMMSKDYYINAVKEACKVVRGDK